MQTQNATFISRLPERGYHAINGEVPDYSQRNFSFLCGCGGNHNVTDTLAVRSHPDEGSAIYTCPENERLLTLVEHTGWFKIKDLKTIASYYSDNPEDSVYSRIFAFAQMREKGINSLKEYFDQH